MTPPAPPAGPDGCWHYTYVTYHPDTGEWYGGKHSTRSLSDGYLGSGNWILTHPTPTELVIEVIEYHATEADAYVAEGILVTWETIDRDPLCRNERDGGEGFTSEAAVRRSANPEWLRKNRENAAKLRVDPEWLRNFREGRAKMVANPEYRRKNREAAAKMRADPEWQRKQREGKARMAATNLEWRQNNLKAISRMRADPDYHRRHREAVLAARADPEYRQRQREAMLKYHAGKPPIAKPGQGRQEFCLRGHPIESAGHYRYCRQCRTECKAKRRARFIAMGLRSDGGERRAGR